MPLGKGRIYWNLQLIKPFLHSIFMSKAKHEKTHREDTLKSIKSWSSLNIKAKPLHRWPFINPSFKSNYASYFGVAVTKMPKRKTWRRNYSSWLTVSEFLPSLLAPCAWRKHHDCESRSIFASYQIGRSKDGNRIMTAELA